MATDAGFFDGFFGTFGFESALRFYATMPAALTQ